MVYIRSRPVDDNKVSLVRPLVIHYFIFHIFVISYLWVLETNTGATWRTGYLRIVRLDATAYWPCPLMDLRSSGPSVLPCMRI